MPSRHDTIWTKDLDEKVASLAAQGMSARAAADTIGLSVGAVSGRAQRLRISFGSRSNDPWTDQDDDKLRKLAGAGRTPAQAARYMNRTPLAVHKRARALGLVLQTSGVSLPRERKCAKRPESSKEDLEPLCAGPLPDNKTQCRWIIGEKPEWKACGRERFHGSYCLEHFERASA